MRLSELDYDLPAELIAQEPLKRRDEARLLVTDRKSKSFEHSRFYKLVRHLRDGDLIVLNDTRVIPARMRARKESGGQVELLLVRPYPEGPSGAWLAMIRVHRPLKEGARLILGDGDILKIIGYARPGRAIIVSEGAASIESAIQRSGTLALPHYIHRDVASADAEDYQTVYAAAPGAIAAPTAGLHFTSELFQALADAGIRTARITLHIGPGTFAPVRALEVERHSMEAEWFTIPPAAQDAIAHTRRIGGRVIPVGTSAVRALESWAITGDAEGATGLFIYPGFRFKITDAMLTNFHMPRTTVLALVMALAGRDVILAAYREAIRHRYRFLSYGDAMLIV
ncbi:MAG TPA: tRNA preQ1(34) S-adenosylmethionine ribosyltransferase-isomerase QueA [Candidatus Binataceae bacterium]|nr:tRNA preQ1(34) S-adenosylmethionine ribosyltransferase-isomerase QueA [Candidatus Binataceae bacterium]